MNGVLNGAINSESAFCIIYSFFLFVSLLFSLLFPSTLAFIGAGGWTVGYRSSLNLRHVYLVGVAMSQPPPVQTFLRMRMSERDGRRKPTTN